MPGDQLSPITQEFRGDASGLLKEVAKVEAAEDSLAKKSKTTADGITKDEKRSGQAVSDFERLLTSKLKDGESGLESLQKEIESTRTHVEGLRQDLARTGNVEIFGDLKQAEADLRHLEGFLDDMKPAVDKKARSLGKSAGDEFIAGIPYAGTAAMAVGKGFVKLLGAMAPSILGEAEQLGVKAAKALGDGVSSAGDAVAQDLPQLFTPEGAAGAAVIAVIGTTLAPAIATALGGAITGAVGVGVLGLGAYLLKDETGVKNAAGRLKDDVLGVFTSGANVLAEPFERAMGKLDQFFTSGAGQIRQLFAAVAPAIDPIESMVESLTKSIGPALISDAHAFADIFSDPSFQSDVAGLGENIAAFFNTIARNKGAVEIFFKVLMGLISEVTGILNVLINTAGFLAKPLEWADNLINGGNNVKATWHDASGSIDGFVTAVNKANPSVSDLTSKLNTQVATVDTLAGAMTDKLVNSVLGNQQAVLHFQESLTGLAKTLHDNHDALKITTAAGQADREAVLASVSANLQQYDSLIQIGMSAKDAATAYDTNTKALERQLRNAGLTKGQIDGLIGSYKNVPDKVDTNLAIQGLTDAINNLDNLMRQLNGLPPLTTVTVHEKFVADAMPDFTHRGKSIAFAQGGVVPAASGLVSGILPPRSPGTLVLAGERQTHGEIFAPLAGISQQRAMGLGQTLGDAYNFDVMPRGRLAMAGAPAQRVVVETHNHLYLDGREIHSSQIRAAQRYKRRTGTTGLT